TEPSLLNGVISATNEPASIFLDITVSIPEFATLNPIDRFIALAATTAKPVSRHLYDTASRSPTAFCRQARSVGLLPEREIGHPVAPSSEGRPCVCGECSLRWRWPAQ